MVFAQLGSGLLARSYPCTVIEFAPAVRTRRMLQVVTLVQVAGRPLTRSVLMLTGAAPVRISRLLPVFMPSAAFTTKFVATVFNRDWIKLCRALVKLLMVESVEELLGMPFAVNAAAL